MTVNLSRDQIELLWRLHGGLPEPWMEERFGPTCGSVKSNLRAFLQAGLLQPMSLRTRVDLALSVAALKAQLRARGMKVSGRKDELVSRLCAGAPEADLRALVDSREAFELTFEGRRVFDDETARKEAVEGRAFQLLREDKIDDALSLVAAERPPSTSIEIRQGETERREAVEYLLESLNNRATVRRE